MKVDGLDVELAGDLEGDDADGGRAVYAATSAALGGPEQAVYGLPDAIGLPGGGDRAQQPPSSARPWNA